MSDEWDWAKDDAYMLAEFNRQQREASGFEDPAYVAEQERIFQEELAAYREDNPGATEEDYVDYLLRDAESR